ncbi:MAG: hypothetical protein CM1200mP18_09520 [Gammaproteobacteria bacterium]|nr:MAG: hypothetical protein CM1200mP18_09520 [Gammaproteobacteria bacterium]
MTTLEKATLMAVQLDCQTLIIRPGKTQPGRLSRFVSGVFREPLNGEDFELPVSVDTVMPLLGYRAISTILSVYTNWRRINSKMIGQSVSQSYCFRSKHDRCLKGCGRAP